MSSHQQDIQQGERFKFGENWSLFLSLVDEERIQSAEHSLQQLLGITDLTDKRFLDIGSGSGLFSLAARRLGAQVVSFDFDPHSVACTTELRRRYFCDDAHWQVMEGSVLDPAFMEGLATFDVVYSWGVLHHTGQMWQAIDYASQRVAAGGLLSLAIYNHQGVRSALWKKIKRFYCRGRLAALLVKFLCYPYYFTKTLAKGVLLHGGNPIGAFLDKSNRGMSELRAWDDWLGGYPFEVAKPEEIFHFLKARHFSLENLTTLNGHGCNEFLFIKR
ncbi:Methyltransferase type 12 [Magnetococcus marinus MC-1]|uniref:Methyltransferase type 12 n=1 Tax=Magnetococcus marinus (strain ATCC BAA-1437 / JCM 17883 / MC-1) TaxID=156889 RepID=A0L4X7_MAGMM|nr:class I SAM-dependent methyltransferase [Magnetococcus marinus]ABK43020.1 Methyltransferase type 12 [Magnetococcus marinus MC-1]